MEIINPWLMKFDDRDVVQYRNEYNNVRISLPEIDKGLVKWLQNYCDVYHCVFNFEYFAQEFHREKDNGILQILNHAYHDQSQSARVGRILHMVKIAHESPWHSPAFLAKIDGQLYFSTGQKKIVATGLAKSFDDFHFILWDFDRSINPDMFSFIESITDDQQLAVAVGSDDFVLDINYVEYQHRILPGVYHFTDHYPAQYDADLSEVAVNNKEFLTTNIPNKKRSIVILDNHNSEITDSSGLFEIAVQGHKNEVTSTDDVRREFGDFTLNTWYFQTNKRIEYDLADMIFYFKKDINMFYAQDRSWFSWIHSDDYAETSCSSGLK